MVRDTSLSAYISISPILGHKQQIVFDTIKLLGSPTDLEITQYLNLGDPNKVRPRRNELLKNGSIVECEKRECSVSGRTVRENNSKILCTNNHIVYDGNNETN